MATLCDKSCHTSYLANEGIKWSFITELVPWMGGFYGSTGTVVKEVDANVNSRPLVYVGADFSFGFPLTPGDFFSLNPQTGVPSLAAEDRQQDPDFLSVLSFSQTP